MLAGWLLLGMGVLAILISVIEEHTLFDEDIYKCGLLAVVLIIYILFQTFKKRLILAELDTKIHFTPKWYDKLPYFGKVLDQKRVLKIIKCSKFSCYKTRDRQTLKHVEISDDGKWILMFGHYLPLDLICGYNSDDNVLYTIDGMPIRLPKKARRDWIRRDIEQFFEDRGIWYETMPKNADSRYMKVCESWNDKIDKENFGKVRYQWEKAVANDANNYWRLSKKKVRYFPSGKADERGTVFFEAVLSDSDITKTVEAVIRGKVALQNFLNFEDYKNEYSVCNGIELLKRLGSEKNKEGIDFLFRCLGDVDEAYFTYAVELLGKYPRELVIEKIEENMSIAFEREDVVNLAGVMYLAKDIGYEAKYIRDLRKLQKGDPTDEAVEAGTVVEGSSGIPEFKYDEALALGSEEVQEFGRIL